MIYWRVAQLINEEDRSWNIPLIKSIFPQEQADAISKIPLSSQVVPNSICWFPDTRGIFIVKSAYKVAQQQQIEAHIRRGKIGHDKFIDLGRYKHLWKMVWGLKTQPKIRIFMWRICRDILPTITKLQQRGIEVEGLCYLCGNVEETSAHVFQYCLYATQVLELLQLQLPHGWH